MNINYSIDIHTNIGDYSMTSWKPELNIDCSIVEQGVQFHPYETMKFQKMVILLRQGRRSAKAKLALSDVPNYQTAKLPNLGQNTQTAPY